MISAADQQIKTLYELNGLSPEQIAEGLELDIAAVKMSLGAHSIKWKNENNVEGKPKSELFDDFEMQIAKQAMLEVLQNSEDPHVKFRAARFIIDERKGRHDKKLLRDVNINIALINEHMSKARQKVKEMNEIKQSEVINV